MVCRVEICLETGVLSRHPRPVENQVISDTPSRWRLRGINDQPMDFPGYFRPTVPGLSPYMSNRNVSLVRARSMGNALASAWRRFSAPGLRQILAQHNNDYRSRRIKRFQRSNAFFCCSPSRFVEILTFRAVLWSFRAGLWLFCGCFARVCGHVGSPAARISSMSSCARPASRSPRSS